MSERRLIGIDLAWGKERGTAYSSTDCEGSGYAELIWDGGELNLTRLCVLSSMDQIVEQIDPARGDWVIAVDAPFVIRNEDGQRPPENQASKLYGKYHAGAHSTNLKRKHRGPQLLEALADQDGALVEEAATTGGRRLFFETYPHIAMVELFGLDRTIKYKTSWIDRNCKQEDKIDCQIAGQQQLVDHIRDHLCSNNANPLLRVNEKLDEVFAESTTDPTALKAREDKLDAVVCAYTAAWLDAKRDLVGLGKVGEGMMIMPRLREIGPPLR